MLPPLPRMNFRPLVFAAFGIAAGIFLFARITLGGFSALDLLFPALFCLFFVRRPKEAARSVGRAAVFLLLILTGSFCMSCYLSSYQSGVPTGDYEISGTVSSVSKGNGYSSVLLCDLSFDGVSSGGNLRLTLSGATAEVGDILRFRGEAVRIALPDGTDAGEWYELIGDIRYEARSSSAEIAGSSASPFLKLNAAVRDLLGRTMTGEEYGLALALLTGNSQSVDDGLLQAVREGGIAHIFAVSGLHIGILFSAVYLAGRPLGRWRVLPALAVSWFYCGLCAFTVSSVRALVMCASAALFRTFGKKYDFLESISFAAACLLIVRPAQFFAVGFRLSFGACLGMALFSGQFSRALCRLPAFLRSYLSVSLAVQIFTFPILIQSFGYYSVWGMALNFFVIPALGVVFPAILACTALSLIFPAAASVLMLCPESVLALLVWMFSSVDLTYVIAGFSLGAGGTVWLIACVALSERFRMTPRGRAATACVFCALFAMCMVFENAVFAGCKISVYSEGESSAVLIRSPSGSTLVIDGDVTVRECEDLFRRNACGTLSAVIVLDEDIVDAVNTAAFLRAERIYLCEYAETGLRETELTIARTFTVDGVTYRYESAEKLMIVAEGSAVEVDFEGLPAMGADFFVDESCGGLILRLKDGIIR